MIHLPKPHDLTPEERYARDQLSTAYGILIACLLLALAWSALGLVVAYLEGWFR